jgi:hypothetical protein
MTRPDDPVATVVTKLQLNGFDPRETGPDQWESRCPAHEGRRYNLSIGRGDDGRALVYCHHADQAGGCSLEAIVSALGMTEADLFPPRDGLPATLHDERAKDGRPKREPRCFQNPEAALAALKLGEPTKVWTYHKADGSEAMRVARFDGPEGKTYRPIHPTRKGWVVGDPPGPLPLYRLHELETASTVFVTEGEKAADLVCGLGQMATTSAHGANGAAKSAWSPLAGREVIILPDDDSPGEGYAQDVLDALAQLQPRPRVRIVRLRDLWKTEAPIPEGGDIAEWLKDGVPEGWDPDQCRAELDRVADRAPEEDLDARPGSEPKDNCGSSTPPWPALRFREPPQAPAFPLHVFPIALRIYCEEAAAALQVPPDFVGGTMLVVAGAAVGQSVNVRVKGGWTEAPLIYLIIVALAGKTKTPTIRMVTKPLSEIDRRLRRESRAARQEWEVKRKAYEKDPENNPPPGDEPPDRRAIVGNVTTEALVIIVKENPRGVLCDPDEASGWVAAFNQYRAKGGSDRQFWLSVWSSSPVRVDRKGGRESHDVPFPFIGVIAGLPPSMLGCLSEERGRDDGFLDRIMCVYPDRDTFPPQHWTEAELSEEAAAAWAEAIERLHSTSMFWDQEKETDRPHFVGFTPEAKAEFVKWYNAHADEVNDPEFPDVKAGAWSKLRSHAARFALILSRLRWACNPLSNDRFEPISVEDMRGAVALVDFFKAHLTRVRHEMSGGVGSADAQELLKWIKRNHKITFRAADVGAIVRRFRKDDRALTAALNALEAAGVIRPRQETHERGRRPSQAYDVHPDLFGAPENTENEPALQDDPAVSGNSGISGRDQNETNVEDREVFEP